MVPDEVFASFVNYMARFENTDLIQFSTAVSDPTGRFLSRITAISAWSRDFISYPIMSPPC